MLKKRIKKYICVLSAVIIAFSSFSVSALSDYYKDLLELSGYVYYDVYDENSNYIDTVIIIPDSVKIFPEPESNKVYLDMVSSVPLKKGYKLYFYTKLYTDIFVPVSSPFFIFHFSNGLKNITSSYSATHSFKPDDFTSNVFFYDNSYYSSLLPDCVYHNFSFVFDITRNTDSLSVVFEMVTDVDDIEQYISNSHSQPRKYKFFSDIGIFFKSAVEWMSDIFDKFVENPAILVLVIGFVIVGFCFGLLRKIIFES